VRLQQVAPGQGTSWVRKGFQVFGRQPLGFASLFAAVLFMSLVLGLIPWLGSIATLVLAPAVSLLFMIASRRVGAGQAAMPGAIVELVSAGRSRLLPLLKLGIAYVAATLLLFWLAGVLDGGALASFFATMRDAKMTPEALAARATQPGVQLGLMLRLLFLGALSTAFWHAPALVFWGDPGWAKSLFFSSVALWRNKGAFALYGLVWMALWMMLLAIVSIGVGVFGPQRFTLVATPLTLIFSTIFYASLWFTFTGCFSPADPAATSPGESSGPTDSLTKGSS
jgi:hypothetical protein